MSVFIKGMKMPKNCDKCPCCCDLGCAVKLITMTTKQIRENRPDWCPLVELPVEHGDLIDRNILVKDLTNGIKAGLYLDGYEEYPNINNMDDCVECVKYADAVIKAEVE